MLTPRIETVVAEKQGKILLAKVDIDENTDLALDYHVSIFIEPIVGFDIHLATLIHSRYSLAISTNLETLISFKSCLRLIWIFAIWIFPIKDL